MNDLTMVNELIRASATVASFEALRSLLDDFSSANGFDYWSLFQWSASGASDIGGFALTNYPQSWLEQISERKYFVDDPVYAASCRTTVGFRTSDVPRILDLSKRQRMTIAESAKAGLGDGLSIPSHLPAEPTGLATFLVRRGKPVPDRLPVMQLAGVFAYAAARRIRRQADAGDRGRVALTVRQTECIILVARGKSDWEISRILGIAEDTVTDHLEEARRRYGVARRTQLVTRALFDGLITLQDAFR